MTGEDMLLALARLRTTAKAEATGAASESSPCV
jgi:hypothetical protein